MSFLDLPEPADRLKSIAEKALVMRRENWPHEGFLYRGGADLLLQYGVFWSGRQLPDEYAHLKGPMGNCFENALVAVEQNPSLLYVEGVYTAGSGHFTPHAWCLTPERELLEVTFPTTDIPENARMYGTGMRILAPEHYGYVGAIFHPEFVRAVWATQEGHVGMLDRPTQDASDGCAEWREDWPVLRVEYSPSRKEL